MCCNLLQDKLSFFYTIHKRGKSGMSAKHDKLLKREEEQNLSLVCEKIITQEYWIFVDSTRVALDFSCRYLPNSCRD